MKNTLTILAYVFFIVLMLFATNFLIKDTFKNQNKPCEEYANVMIERIPARCVNYFTKLKPW